MSTETKKIIASESCHWYTQDGQPCYEVPKAKGNGMRPTTLRDARKLGLVPSVTSVLQILARPGLEAWKQNNILLAAATMPHDPNMPLETWCDRVAQDAKEQSEKAMQLGTDIHAALEAALTSDEVIETKYDEYIEPLLDAMLALNLINISQRAEKSFAHPIGFGGKIDFYNEEYLIDFKTKAFAKQDVDDKKQLAWDEHCWQLAAYRYGIQKPHLRCLNIFISTTEPGLFHFHEWTEEELKTGSAIFLETLKLWKLIKGI